MELIFATSFVSERVVYALSWTLLHSIWQGAILALLAKVVVQCIRSKHANLSYNLLSSLLFIFLLSVGFTFYSQWNQSPQLESRVFMTTKELLTDTQITSNEIVFTSPSMLHKLENGLSILSRLFDQNKHLLLLLWGFIFWLKSIKMLLDITHTYTLRNSRVYPLPLHWQVRLRDLAASMGLRQKVLCLESALIQGAATFGFLRPLILLPIGLINQLSPAQVEAILLHELAHIQRRDYLVNLLQCFLENLFFFNPGLRWVSQRIRTERENCCDDLAIQVLNDKTLYVNALLGYQAYKTQEYQYVQAFWGQKMHLLDRVKRILKRGDYPTLNVPEKISLLLGVLLMGMLMLWAVPVISMKTTTVKSTAIVSPQKRKTERRFSDINTPSAEKEEKPDKTESLIMQTLGEIAEPEITDASLNSNVKSMDTIPPDQSQLAQLQMDLALVKNQYEQEQVKFESLKAQADKMVTELGEKIYRTLEGERVQSHDKVKELLVADLIADGVIKDKKQLRSYRLDKNSFKVNGRKQADELMQTYQQKYIMNPTTGNYTRIMMLDRTSIIQYDGTNRSLPK